MTTVYIIEHDIGGYDSQLEIRAVYATREVAEASVVTRTPSGERSEAWTAHNEACCGVVEHDVLSAPVFDVQADPEQVAQTGGSMVSDAFMDALVAMRTGGPFSRSVKP